MATTTANARDEMLTLFRDAWVVNAPAAAGSASPPRVIWDATEEDPDNGPRSDEPWARVNISHNPPAGGQRTFGGPGNRRFARAGVLTVQVFTPMSVEQSVTMAEALAVIARDAFEGVSSPSGVWFRQVGIQEVGPDDPWFQLNVTAEFSYDELK